MMRSPTPLSEQLAWWHAALHGASKIVAVIDAPQVGWFKRRLAHGAIYVPARIFLEQETDEAGELVADEVLRCEVNGEPRNPFFEWPFLWNNCIPEAEFRYMVAQAEWAREFAPWDPAARPRERLDSLRTPIRF